MSYHVKTTLCHDITTYDISGQPYCNLHSHDIDGKRRKERGVTSCQGLKPWLLFESLVLLRTSELQSPNQHILFHFIPFVSQQLVHYVNLCTEAGYLVKHNHFTSHVFVSQQPPIVYNCVYLILSCLTSKHLPESFEPLISLSSRTCRGGCGDLIWCLYIVQLTCG